VFVGDRSEALDMEAERVGIIIMGKAEESKCGTGREKLGWLGYLKNDLL
jgi:hypothetical protein